jgi:hypothetical protein
MHNPYMPPRDPRYGGPAGPYGWEPDASVLRVIFWYRVYAGAMALLYLVCAAAAGAVLAFFSSLPAELQEDPSFALTMGLVVLLCFPFFVFYVVAMLAPRRKWGWGVGMVAICIGLMGCPTLLGALPLLIKWMKPELKAAFGP